MTRSDVLADTSIVLDLIEKSNISRDEKNKIQKVISDQSNVLDNVWCSMITIMNTAEAYYNKETSTDRLFAKLFEYIVKQLASAFQEKDFFNLPKEDDKKN